MNDNAFTVISAVILGSLVIAILFSVPLWFLWNWLVPSIFSLREIGIVEAFGLMFLTKILFTTTVNNK